MDREAFPSTEAWLACIARVAPLVPFFQIRAKTAPPTEKAQAVRVALAGRGRPLLNGPTEDATSLGASGAHTGRSLVPLEPGAVGPADRGLGCTI